MHAITMAGYSTVHDAINGHMQGSRTERTILFSDIAIPSFRSSSPW